MINRATKRLRNVRAQTPIDLVGEIGNALIGTASRFHITFAAFLAHALRSVVSPRPPLGRACLHVVRHPKEAGEEASKGAGGQEAG